MPLLAIPDQASMDRAARQRGRERHVAQLLWGAAVLLALVVFAAGVPARYQLLSVPPDAIQTGLAQLGLSTGLYAGYLVGLTVCSAVVHIVVAAMIVRRGAGARAAPFVGLSLIVWGVADPSTIEALILQQPAWFIPARLVFFLRLASLILFFFVFPDGQFVPRQARLPLCLVLGYLLYALLAVYAVNEGPPMLVVATLIAGVVAQIYRYMRVSGPVQRRQTKWVVFGVSVMMIGLVLHQFLFHLLGRGLLSPTLAPVLSSLWEATAVCLFFLLIPLSIGVAILRSRLYDIDLIINRALVYGLLTGSLLAVYLAGVVILQEGFRALTGQDAELAIIISTLAIAVLFQPLRAGLQTFIDQRFYRRKYDAARTLAGFSTRLRNEVDLPVLSQELVTVVQETMQPAHVSLWLRTDTTSGRHLPVDRSA